MNLSAKLLERLKRSEDQVNPLFISHELDKASSLEPKERTELKKFLAEKIVIAIEKYVQIPQPTYDEETKFEDNQANHQENLTVDSLLNSITVDAQQVYVNNKELGEDIRDTDVLSYAKHGLAKKIQIDNISNWKKWIESPQLDNTYLQYYEEKNIKKDLATMFNIFSDTKNILFNSNYQFTSIGTRFNPYKLSETIISDLAGYKNESSQGCLMKMIEGKDFLMIKSDPKTRPIASVNFLTNLSDEFMNKLDTDQKTKVIDLANACLNHHEGWRPLRSEKIDALNNFIEKHDKSNRLNPSM